MTSYLRLQNFIAAAQQGYSAPSEMHLVYQGDQAVLEVGSNRSRYSRLCCEQNRRTWDVFLRSVNDALGAGRMEKICRRYRFNPHELQRKGAPLLPQHIEMFSVGASRMTTRDVKQLFQGERLKDLSMQELSERFHVANPFRMMDCSIDPQLIQGTPTEISAYFWRNSFLMDKETQVLCCGVQELSFTDWQERFCKTVVNRELSEKQVIQAPGTNGRIEYYKVYRKIAAGNGLVAYALSPMGNDSSLKPVVFFRPTQFNLSAEESLESYMNDMEPHIGEMGYSSAKLIFDQLMQDPKFCSSEVKIGVAGYSLGGAHAQRFVADYWRQVSEATFYNDPSVDSGLAERFAQEVNEAGPLVQPIRLNIMRTVGDAATYIGEKHLGWGVNHPDAFVQLFEFDHQHRQLSLLQLHAVRVFDNLHSNYRTTVRIGLEEFNAHLDNEARGNDIFWYEKTRKLWGPVIYWILYVIREINFFLKNMLGIEVFHDSQKSKLRS